MGFLSKPVHICKKCKPWRVIIGTGNWRRHQRRHEIKERAEKRRRKKRKGVN